MITNIEKKQIRDKSFKALSIAKKLEKERIKLGFRSMRKGRMIILVNPNRFEEKLNDGYQFINAK